MIAILVNGASPIDSTQSVSVSDRGFNYGDGLFETAICKNGQVRFLESHLYRLRASCERLGMAFPEQPLREDIRTLCARTTEGILKIVVTRGSGGRGYRPLPDLRPTRVVSLWALPAAGADVAVKLRWCDMRLGRNALLAGMKHLNRLEQVLAQREWDDSQIAEGLMLDTEGELVSGTMSNIFVVNDGTLITPDLRFCGVRGVMRGEVLRIARELGIPTSEEPLWPHDLEQANEVFITNAVRGIRAVVELAAQQWQSGPITRAITSAVNQ